MNGTNKISIFVSYRTEQKKSESRKKKLRAFFVVRLLFVCAHIKPTTQSKLVVFTLVLRFHCVHCLLQAVYCCLNHCKCDVAPMLLLLLLLFIDKRIFIFTFILFFLHLPSLSMFIEFL